MTATSCINTSSIVGAMACPRPVTSPNRGACPTTSIHQNKLYNSKNKMEQNARYLLYKTEHTCSSKNKMEQYTRYLLHNTKHI